MAKIKFGMMMTDARGKLGGQVFSKNRAGAYVRTKVTPVNGRTVAQMFNRNILGSLSAGWNSLTQAQINAWNEAVSDWQKTDVFGDLKKPTGKNLYTSLNKNLLQSAQSPLTLPPAKIDIPTNTATAVAVDETASTITFTGLASVPSDVVLQIRATEALPTGVSYIKNRLRVIDNVATGAITPANIFTAYEDKFGTIVPGQKIGFELKYIGDNGQAGVPITFFAVAV